MTTPLEKRNGSNENNDYRNNAVFASLSHRLNDDREIGVDISHTTGQLSYDDLSNFKTLRHFQTHALTPLCFSDNKRLLGYETGYGVWQRTHTSPQNQYKQR